MFLLKDSFEEVFKKNYKYSLRVRNIAEEIFFTLGPLFFFLCINNLIFTNISRGNF